MPAKATTVLTQRIYRPDPALSTWILIVMIILALSAA
jgi:hypothetical protein